MITVYNTNQSAEWDMIVKSFEKHDVYYLSGYVKAFKINGDGEPILIYFENASTRAINVVCKRDISDCKYFEELEKHKYFDIITPYGYGGWIVEGDDYSGLIAEYEAFCCNENIVSEFVRFNPISKNWIGLENLYDEIHQSNTVYIDTSTENIIWNNFSSKNRNVIRKAQKNNLKVYWGREPKLIDSFMEIYNATMKKDNADDYYYFRREFYESILNDLKQNAMWFFAKKDEEVVAMAIFLFCNGNMHYHLSGSKIEYQSFAPTNLILYEASVWAAGQGYKMLHLGGGVGASHDSLYKFKKAFNRMEDLEFYVGKRIFMNREYECLIEARKKTLGDIESTRFFPAYRA